MSLIKTAQKDAEHLFSIQLWSENISTIVIPAFLIWWMVSESGTGRVHSLAYGAGYSAQRWGCNVHSLLAAVNQYSWLVPPYLTIFTGNNEEANTLLGLVSAEITLVCWYVIIWNVGNTKLFKQSATHKFNIPIRWLIQRLPSCN